ncbi:uncharacterized protein N0V89_006405 [Didymosphaeria variabile]|uniref:Mid2 domain-containing protein n=1 Tax=Didymosphaeria variabile TaxID=1932322 RepID=A0A9W9CCM3_9PLEO|nr:uncharacterized protein N0V89_006405 [Didymosphaeria variabile]KAJ4354668.1 hypothetical protein N0V89_006405 [Didymosphaeria variabile]
MLARASASTPASTDASTTSTATPSTTASQSASPTTDLNLTATPTSTSDSKFSISIGGVAGGILGGLVGLAAICAGVLFFLRRRKRKNLYAAPTDQPPQNPFDTPASSYATPVPYGGQEIKPPGVADGTYAWGGGGVYPQGAYDPHYGAAEMPAQPPTRNGVAEMDAGSYAAMKYAHATDVPLQPMSPPAELPSQAPAPQELPTQR